jgi:hypothetical protein
VFSLPTAGGEQFSLSSVRGRTSVDSFVNIWAPPALEQIALISNYDLPSTIVINNSTVSKDQVFLKKGGYKTDFVVDRDVELLESYNLSSTPTHYFLDRSGIVQRVVTGVLDETEINQILNSI